MLGKFTGENESDAGCNVREMARRGVNVENLRCLDLSGADGGLLVVRSKLGGFSGNALEYV